MNGNTSRRSQIKLLDSIPSEHSEFRERVEEAIFADTESGENTGLLGISLQDRNRFDLEKHASTPLRELIKAHGRHELASGVSASREELLPTV